MTHQSPNPAEPNLEPNPAEVLYRLRQDVPEAEVLADPPPIPTFDGPFALRVAGTEAGTDASNESHSSDAELVAEWMSRPHLVETWEQPWEADRWTADWNAKKSTTYSIPLILRYAADGSNWLDVGYIEIYRPHRDEIAHTYQSKPHDLGFHIAIGDPELTGKGIFSAFSRKLAEGLLEEDPDCDLVILEPDYRNTRTHRGLQKNGWVNIGERQQRPDRRVRLFFFPAPGVDTDQRGAKQDSTEQHSTEQHGQS